MKNKIALIGLGYVGLPLAVAFGQKTPTIGFDINVSRIKALKKGQDSTFEVGVEELQSAVFLSFTSDPHDIKDCNIYIITVPTPIDQHNNPDLTPLIKSSIIFIILLLISIFWEVY